MRELFDIIWYYLLNNPCKPCLHNQTCKLLSNYQEPWHWFSYSVLPRELVLNSKRFCVRNTNAVPTKNTSTVDYSSSFCKNNFTCKLDWTSMENEKHCYKGIASTYQGYNKGNNKIWACITYIIKVKIVEVIENENVI